MEHYIIILTFIGLASLSMAWMPKVSEYTGISYAIIYLVIGFIIYSMFPDHLPSPLPQQNHSVTLHLTELVVIISLMGAGIRIDRPFKLKNWASPLKLATITMVLCVIGASLLGYYFLGMGFTSAILLGAILAPTDPVLAADVQVGPPNERTKSETRFALTAEAGLNDGTAFPFTWLAIAVGMISLGDTSRLENWFFFDVLYRILSGVFLGYLFGKGFGYLLFSLAKKYKVLKTRDGLFAISITLVVYGLTEMISGYGFIAVFICAITLRHYEKEHDYHTELHSFSDQVERLLICILLILVGGSLATGILEPLDWKMAIFVLLFIFLIRPLAGMLTLTNSKILLKEKLAISFFGIKGMGSVFYLAFAISKFDFNHQDELWAILAFTILISVMLHGFTATRTMKKLTKKV